MNTSKLYELIHSMSGVERRYFQQSIRGGKESKSVKLFLAILKQTEYEEAPLIKKFGYTKNPNGFAVAKNHLYKLILKVLRETSIISSDYQKVVEHLKDIEILEKRGLRIPALKSLQKLQEIAKANQWGAFLLVGEKWKYRLTDISEIPSLSVPNVGCHIDTEIQYANFYRQLVYDNLIYGANQRLDEVHSYQSIITHPLMRDMDGTPNLLCQWYFCLVKVELAKSERNVEKRQVWAEKLIATKYKMGEHGYIEYDWRTTSHFEYLNALIASRKLTDFYEEYSKMLNFEIPKHRLDLHEHRKRDALLLRLHAFIYDEYAPEVFKELMQKAEQYICEKGRGAMHMNDVSLITTMTYLYYSSGQYDKVLDWNAFFNINIDRNLYIDSFVINQVLVILSHQKLNNFEHIQSLLPALERHMEKHNRLVPVHVFLLQYLKRMQHPISKKERNALLRDFKSNMKVLIKSGSKGYYLKPKSLLIWAESQIANMTLFEMNQFLFKEDAKKWT